VDGDSVSGGMSELSQSGDQRSLPCPLLYFKYKKPSP